VARERAQVLAVWQTRPDGSRAPALARPLPPGASLMDATGQPAANVPAAPNVLVVEAWAEAAYLDSLGDDVLFREAAPDAGP
jgi:hypothetical protein